MADPRPITQEELLKFWYDALREEHGITFTCASAEDGKWIQDRLYEARADIGDQKIMGLSIHLSKDGLEIMIYKKPEAQLT